MRDLESYMRKFGSTESQIASQVDRLSRANLAIYPQDEQHGLLALTAGAGVAEHDGQSVPDSPVSRWMPSEADLPSVADFSPTSPVAPTELAESGDDNGAPDDFDLDGRPRWISPFEDTPAEATSMLDILKASAELIIDPEDCQNPTGGLRTPTGEQSAGESVRDEVEADEDSSDSSSVGAQELSEALDQQESEDEASPFGFVVALTQSGIRRLHFVGACGRVPGLHFGNFIRYGNRVPAAHEFDKACVVCFGKKGVVAMPGTKGQSDSEDTGEDDSTEDSPGE